MNFLMEMLYLFVILVHHKLYGDPIVAYVATDKVVRLEYKVKGCIYTFISTQHVYTVINTGLLKYRTNTYFYKVKLKTNSTTIEDNLERCYTMLCPFFLRNTTYPHRLAINAHFKFVTKEL